MDPWCRLVEGLADARLDLAPAARADRVARLDRLRRLAGLLQAAEDADAVWLGAQLAHWLQRGGDLAARLGVKPPRGSHGTPQQLIRVDERDAQLLALVEALGSDAEALRVLSGQTRCPPGLAMLVQALRAAGGVRNRHAFRRARVRASSVMTSASP